MGGKSQCYQLLMTNDDVSAIFDGDIVTVEGDRYGYGYGEQRFITFGLLQGRVIAVVGRVSRYFWVGAFRVRVASPSG